jgi:hypothetical protein
LVNTARRADIVIRRPAMSTSIQSANECDRLPTLAADLVARELSLIAAISGPSALAAKIAIGPATRSISSAFSPRSTQKFQHCFVAWVAALTDVSADVIAFYNNIGHRAVKVASFAERTHFFVLSAARVLPQISSPLLRRPAVLGGCRDGIGALCLVVCGGPKH